MDWGHAHRPYPPPTHRPWVLHMTWVDLLFMHWPVAPALLRPLVPPGLELDTRAGTAWVGVVPFVMTDTRPHGAPRFPGRGIPGLTTFPELNVRTYVTREGRPGVWFFSLDAASWPAVWGARTFFRLNYQYAVMAARREGEAVRYESRRRGPGPAAEFRGRYRPTGPVRAYQPGDLVSFLTDRYCLYAADEQGRLYRAEIHHPPWTLQDAEAAVECNTMAAAAGMALPDTPPLLHFARRLEVVAWWEERA